MHMKEYFSETIKKIDLGYLHEPSALPDKVYLDQ